MINRLQWGHISPFSFPLHIFILYYIQINIDCYLEAATTTSTTTTTTMIWTIILNLLSLHIIRWPVAQQQQQWFIAHRLRWEGGAAGSYHYHHCLYQINSHNLSHIFAVNSANITPPSSAVAGYTIIQCKLQSEGTQTDRSSDDDDHDHDHDDQC